MEHSVVLIKPDALQRGLVGEIIHRFERKGLQLVGIKMLSLDDPILDQWYGHHKDKPFFAGLKNYMTSSPVVAMLWAGVEAVSTVRRLTGITKGREAETGSIRGDFGMSQQLNLIHASENAEIAKKEEKLIFKPQEIFAYPQSVSLHIYTKEELEEIK
ncbi:nucleoside-diphosphate kinase [Candidatus Microgenomates bacterium]|nr:nucleoside-diphosphate kinase [Candidatus Microgenomates bacterium]